MECAWGSLLFASLTPQPPHPRTCSKSTCGYCATSRKQIKREKKPAGVCVGGGDSVKCRQTDTQRHTETNSAHTQTQRTYTDTAHIPGDAPHVLVGWVDVAAGSTSAKQAAFAKQTWARPSWEAQPLALVVNSTHTQSTQHTHTHTQHTCQTSTECRRDRQRRLASRSGKQRAQQAGDEDERGATGTGESE